MIFKHVAQFMANYSVCWHFYCDIFTDIHYVAALYF